MSKQGDRYNKDKIRFHLVPHRALKGVANVFTMGAKKYDDWNWQRGLPWMEVVSSLQRHLESFIDGEDYDPESGELHVNHITANSMMLADFYVTNPQHDNRPHFYLDDKKIGLDVDGVLANFWKGVQKRMNMDKFPEATYWNFPYSYKYVWDEIVKNEDFWLSLEPMADSYLPFEPDCYITDRQVDSSVTAEWLETNGFPSAPVITVNGSKVAAVKERKLDLFVDDRWINFVDINKRTNCACYLMSREYNKRYDVGYRRITDLKQIV